ncbi:hypothetical protein OG772_36015 [Streptomyces sp. NBC_01321]|uniref:hypothetical protein n=1 Tax=Streptomyces sp. NBC_01321 TaxID=2903825 RepID=UPI002E1186B3|nr:hypothetical protein OG772_36015 [Streptomyces sp. NBC_01321]
MGESTDSYVRRLARANHLRPSALHGYLCGPPFWFGKPQIERAVWLADGPDKAVRLVVGLISALALWGTAIWTVMGAASAASHGVRE